MDKASPWFRLGEAEGKVIFLGNDFEANSSIHVVEYVHSLEHPDPLFFNKPLLMKFKKRNGEPDALPVWVHPLIRKAGSANRFCSYLNRQSPIYRIHDVRGAAVTIFSAKAQYEAVYAAMNKGIGLYNSMFW